MTARRRPLAVAVALALTSLLAAACSSANATPSDTSSPRSPVGETEEARGNRAKGALESISPDDPKFVESGLERVSDGAHSRPSLEKGKAYKVSLACVGTGTVKVVIGEKTPQSLPCDGISMSHDVRNSAEESPMDVTAAPGATGMVAWQIIAVSS